ncbi:MAG TPA: hypothetical protein PKA03_11625, partial [Tabrizicola sp.]|nr:hypothetical protein [Tabrizicola sp.]
MAFERLVRTLHSWLGLLILPWVILAGFTGLYLNHEDLVLSVLPDGNVGASAFIDGGTVLDEASARTLAETQFGPVEGGKSKEFEGRKALSFKARDGSEVLVDMETGHSWLVSRYVVTLYAPDGTVLAHALRGGRLLPSLHERGWGGSALGPWLADITACA